MLKRPYCVINYQKLKSNMFKDGSCCIAENIKSGKLLCGVSQDAEETSEEEVEPSQYAEGESYSTGFRHS